jgi:hypothetical protein
MSPRSCSGLAIRRTKRASKYLGCLERQQACTQEKHECARESNLLI